MSRDQTLSFTAVEVSRILLGLGGEFCSRAEFCSGLRRIRVGGAECKFQIPWLFSLLGNVVLSRMQIPNSRDCARRECRAESRDFDKHELTVKIPQKILLSRGEYRIMTDQNHKRNLTLFRFCLQRRMQIHGRSESQKRSEFSIPRVKPLPLRSPDAASPRPPAARAAPSPPAPASPSPWCCPSPRRCSPPPPSHACHASPNLPSPRAGGPRAGGASCAGWKPLPRAGGPCAQ